MMRKLDRAVWVVMALLIVPLPFVAYHWLPVEKQ